MLAFWKKKKNDPVDNTGGGAGGQGDDPLSQAQPTPGSGDPSWDHSPGDKFSTSGQLSKGLPPGLGLDKTPHDRNVNLGPPGPHPFKAMEVGSAAGQTAGLGSHTMGSESTAGSTSSDGTPHGPPPPPGKEPPPGGLPTGIPDPGTKMPPVTGPSAPGVPPGSHTDAADPSGLSGLIPPDHHNHQA